MLTFGAKRLKKHHKQWKQEDELNLVDVCILHHSGENCVLVGEKVGPRRSQRRIREVCGGKRRHGGRLLGNKLVESRHDEGRRRFLVLETAEL